MKRCRIPAFRELRLKIKRHFSAIVAAAKHGLSNARVGATNNKIKLLIRTAYGFRNTDSLIAMVMLSCSSVQPFGAARLENACERLLAFTSTPSIRTLSTILKNGQDKVATPKKPEVPKANTQHGITRGAAYFRKGGGSK